MKKAMCVFLVFMILSLTSCSDRPSPPSLGSYLTSKKTWTLSKATSNGVDVKNTFLIQEMALYESRTASITTYSIGSSSGRWNSDYNSLTVALDSTGDTYTFTSASVTSKGTLFKASITIPAGTGKTTAAVVEVEYTGQ